MAALVSVPPPEISQEELETLIGIQNQMRTLGRIYTQRTAEILQRLLNGARVQHGNHVAELAESVDGPQKIVRLSIH